jgi:hypothetical protein
MICISHVQEYINDHLWEWLLCWCETKVHWSKSCNPRVFEVIEGRAIPDWKKFLSSGTNKQALIRFIGDHIAVKQFNWCFKKAEDKSPNVLYDQTLRAWNNAMPSRIRHVQDGLNGGNIPIADTLFSSWWARSALHVFLIAASSWNNDVGIGPIG